MLAFFLLAIGASLASAQMTTSTSIPSTTTTAPHWIDPSIGGRYGYPGARIHLSNKSIDDVHRYAANAIANIIKNQSVADLQLSVGQGILTIKPPHVNDVKYSNVGNDISPSAKIYSQFGDGRITATGVWYFKPVYNRNLAPLNGTYQATIKNATFNTTTQLGRTYDGKPSIQILDCKSYLGDFSVNVDGAGELTEAARALVQTCTNPTCVKIRQFYEESICVAVRTFVKETVNAKLQTYPNRVNGVNEHHKIDYNLLNNEPSILHGYLQAGLEGKAIWRGSNYVPFSPNPLNFVDNGTALVFELSDFSYNTVLQQAHSHQYPLSADHIFQQGSIVTDQLRLNCSMAKPKAPARKLLSRIKSKSINSPTVQCLGSLFDNITGVADQFPWNATGDFVYRTTQKAASVFVQSSQLGFFDGGVGVLEILGPIGGNNQRQQLARVDVRSISGQFFPKFVNGNFTGSVKINSIEIDKVNFGSAQTRLLRMDTSDFSQQLVQFAIPVLTDVFNVLITRVAQFPVPLLDGFECDSPKFLVSSRTMQVDCGIRSKQ